MRLLLDSQAAYWFVIGSRRMSAVARAAVQDTTNQASFSVICLYEIGFKAQRGKLTDDVARDFHRYLRAANLTPLTLTIEHMQQGAALNWRHGDPWDRLMAAQAIHDGLTLVSADQKFDELPIKRLW